MGEDKAMLAWWLLEMALQLGAAGGQSTAAAPWPLQGCQEYPPWTLGQLWGLWVAEAPRPLHCLVLQGRQVGPHLFLGSQDERLFSEAGTCAWLKYALKYLPKTLVDLWGHPCHIDDIGERDYPQ